MAYHGPMAYGSRGSMGRFVAEEPLEREGRNPEGWNHGETDRVYIRCWGKPSPRGQRATERGLPLERPCASARVEDPEMRMLVSGKEGHRRESHADHSESRA